MNLKNLIFKHIKLIGEVPGSIDLEQEPGYIFNVTKITYNEFHYERDDLKSVDDLDNALKNIRADQVTWININSLNPKIIHLVSETLGIHPLVQEDIARTHQRPKAQDWFDYMYVVIKMLSYSHDSKKIEYEQLSFIHKGNLILSFQEKPGDVFKLVRDRIINSRGRIRKMASCYLLFSLLDCIVDNYYLVLDTLNAQAEKFELALEEDVSNSDLRSIQKLKREVSYIRRFTFPVKELLHSIKKIESSHIHGATRPFFEDLEENAYQASEATELLKDSITSIIDMANSNISNRMNEIMKVLTMVSSIFIPITFIAGIYGMNFEHMPELKLSFAYPLALSVMFCIVILMLIYFKIKGWW